MRQTVPLGLVLLLSFLFGAGTGALAQTTPPIIDLHFHAQPGWNIGALVRLFDQLGVAKAAGGPAGPDTLGLSFASAHPDRFIPFGGMWSLVMLIQREGADIWNLQSPRITDYLRVLESLLRGGNIKGIGEVFPNNLNTPGPNFAFRFPADSPLMRRLMAFSGTYGVPVHVHAEADGPTTAEMERLLESTRQGILLWAHTGFFIEPPALRRLFQQHSNLFCELSWRDERRSYRGIPISQGGQIRPEWKELFEEFPDRCVIGTDVASPSLDGYSALITYWRGILKQLSPEAAEKLAHQNAERLLKHPPLGK